ncbi:MAG: hypothetical protein FWC43_12345 [Planctomycetaceae bacterium]|nr:hypothetical protein [Planctomycetaceae bacterium]
MITRRQFCGVLGGAVVGGAVFAGSKSVLEEKTVSLADDPFFASKIHLEQWFTELRHRPLKVRLDEFRRRFAEIRTHSEAVLFVPGEGIPSVFQEELVCEAKGVGLRVLAPADSPEVAWSALEKIQNDTNGFATLAFPLAEIDRRIQIAKSVPRQTVCGYLYTRFSRESVPSVPLAVILFETSRCLWETYVPGSMLPEESRNPRPVLWAGVDHGYARLIDQTRVRFSDNANKQ